MDFNSLSLPSSSLQAPAAVDGGSLSSTLQQIRDAVVGGYSAYYGTKAEIARAKADAELAKAQARGQIISAQTGLPPPSILIYGGLALAAVLLISRSGGRR